MFWACLHPRSFKIQFSICNTIVRRPFVRAAENINEEGHQGCEVYHAHEFSLPGLKQVHVPYVAGQPLKKSKSNVRPIVQAQVM